MENLTNAWTKIEKVECRYLAYIADALEASHSMLSPVQTGLEIFLFCYKRMVGEQDTASKSM